MPGNDREVFDKLAGNGGDATPINFITYAMFAFERREWVGHFENANGNAPTQADIDAWTSNFTDSQFASLRGEAVRFFDDAARQYMADEVEEARQETLKGAVVREVKAAGNFWRQLLIALVTAILAPVIVGLIVVAALRSEDFIPTIRGTKGAAEVKQEPSTQGARPAVDAPKQ